jgi:hypothetical protein
MSKILIELDYKIADAIDAERRALESREDVIRFALESLKRERAIEEMHAKACRRELEG